MTAVLMLINFYFILQHIFQETISHKSKNISWISIIIIIFIFVIRILNKSSISGENYSTVKDSVTRNTISMFARKSVIIIMYIKISEQVVFLINFPGFHRLKEQTNKKPQNIQVWDNYLILI